MGKFRVGDVCEVIDHPSLWNPYHRALIGEVVTVVGHRRLKSGDQCVEVDRTHPLTANPFCFGPEHLRLRRPPAWDRWIYQTDDVKREHERQEQLDRLQAMVDKERS